MQNETQESKDGLRSFIVLMDKNKDTQWLEDGKFVDNPLPKPSEIYDSHAFTKTLEKIAGFFCVKDVIAQGEGKNITSYKVRGYSRTCNMLLTRTVTIQVA